MTDSFEAEYFTNDERKRKAIGKKMIRDSEEMKDYEYQWKNIKKAGEALVAGDWKKFKNNINQLDTSPREVIKESYGSQLSQIINPSKINQIYSFDAESFEADMTVGDGFKLGVGAILGFTAIGAAFGLLGNVIGNLIGTKEE